MDRETAREMRKTFVWKVMTRFHCDDGCFLLTSYVMCYDSPYGANMQRTSLERSKKNNKKKPIC